MKKLLLILLCPILLLTSCSKPSVTPEIESNIEETIVGKTWKLLNSESGWFHLNDNNTYLTKDNLCDSLEQFGAWELDGSVLIMTHIIGSAEYVERNTIIAYNDSIFKVQANTSNTLDVNIIFEVTEEEVIRGCMNSLFLNFNPNAQCPDTCINAPVYGCTDSTALNYNPLANTDDGSCILVDNYNRTLLLENLTNNIIIPAHINLQSKIENLNNKLENFTSNQTPTNFSELRNSYVSTYIAWQSVEMFNLGKAEEIDYVKKMNTYPCNTTVVNNNISSNQYDLSSSNFSSWTSQGLPTLDYMLYGLNNDSNLVINNYTDPVNGSKYLDYLNSIINQMTMDTDDVVQYWQANATSFIDSDANTATSSLNILTNDFIYYITRGVRANKIGIPCGRWDNYQIYEIGVEAYYRKDISKRLALESLSACKNFFTGVGFNSNIIEGQSYVDYLTHIGDVDISVDIISGLDLAKDKINNLDDNFRFQLLNNNSSMIEAFDALQQVVVYLTSDMLISLQITIDHVTPG